MDNQVQNDEFGSAVFEQFMELFVMPEIERRQDVGELEKPLDLRAAQIVFFPDSRKNQVRINSEIKGLAEVKLKPGISKGAHEDVFEHELESMNFVELSEEDDPDCGHATLLRIGNRWSITFDFRYNKALSRKHIEAAKQFYGAAQYPLSIRVGRPSLITFSARPNFWLDRCSCLTQTLSFVRKPAIK